MAGAWADIDEEDYPEKLSSQRGNKKWNQATAVNPWDVVYIKDLAIPGICEISATPGRRVERKVKKGSNKETVTVVGYHPADVEIKTTIWTAEQYDRLVEFVRKVFPKNTAADNSYFKIEHPSLEMYSIQQIRIISMSTLSAGPVPKSMTIKALEYVAAPEDKNSKAKNVKGIKLGDVNTNQKALGKSAKDKKAEKPSENKDVSNNPNHSTSSGT